MPNPDPQAPPPMGPSTTGEKPPPAAPQAPQPGSPTGGTPAMPALMPYGRPVWPVVIGVLSMVLAGYSMLALVGLVLQVALAVLTGGGIGSIGQTFAGGIGPWEIVQLSHQILVPTLAIVLMVGGYLLCRESRLGPLLLVIYAVPVLLLSLVHPIAYILTVPSGFPRQAVMLWPIWSATRLSLYPAFLLVWFTRSKIRRQLRQWR